MPLLIIVKHDRDCIDDDDEGTGQKGHYPPGNHHASYL